MFIESPRRKATSLVVRTNDICLEIGKLSSSSFTVFHPFCNRRSSTRGQTPSSFISAPTSSTFATLRRFRGVYLGLCTWCRWPHHQSRYFHLDTRAYLKCEVPRSMSREKSPFSKNTPSLIQLSLSILASRHPSSLYFRTKQLHPLYIHRPKVYLLFSLSLTWISHLRFRFA